MDRIAWTKQQTSECRVKYRRCLENARNTYPNVGLRTHLSTISDVVYYTLPFIDVSSKPIWDEIVLVNET